MLERLSSAFLLLQASVSWLLACFASFSYPSYRGFTLASLKLDKQLFQLFILQRNLQPSLLSKLDQLKLKLLRELGLNHLQVSQPLPSFRRQYVPKQGFLLSLQLLLRLCLSLLVSHLSLKR
jgi:hypothetical protein